MSSATAPGDPARLRRWAGALVFALCASAWSVGNHWLVLSAGGARISAALSALSVSALAWWIGRRARGTARLAAFAAALGVPLLTLLAAIAWTAQLPGPGPASRYGSGVALLLMPHVAGCLLVAGVFGASLLPGREALVVRMARLMRGELSASHARYARSVTWAWCVFLCALAGASVLLFITAPLAVWSTYANLLTLPLLALMFVAEYAYRAVRRPELLHGSLLTGVEALRRIRAAAPAARTP